MNRIEKLFKKSEEKLMPFFTAGYPKINSLIDLALLAKKVGCHMIEIGVPFSDPQADGPIIQRSSEVALKNGISINLIFEQIKEIRSKTEIPISLFSYINPIMNFGVDKFLDRCSQVGIDGVILPDLPYDEAELFCSKSRALGISPILLVAPNTSNKRIEEISIMADNLIYAVSILGITGNKLTRKDELKSYLKRVKKHSKAPFIVGFGISNRKDVIWFNKYSDGAVVGSAIIQNMIKNNNSLKETEHYLNDLLGK